MVLTASAEEHDVLEALAAGASGYLLKDTRVDGLMSALRWSPVVTRCCWATPCRCSSRISGPMIGQQRRRSPALLQCARARDHPADRRRCEQRSHRPRPVDLQAHRQAARDERLEKLGVQNRVLVAVYAVRHGLA